MFQSERIRIVAWVVSYLAFAFGVVLLQPQDGPAPWYPPVAIGIGMLMRAGVRWWPLILVMEIPISTVQYHTTPLAGLLVATATTVEAVAGWWLLRRLRLTFDTAQDALLLGLVSAVTALTGAVLGTLLVLPLGSAEDQLGQLLAWFTGDVIALATLLPLILFVIDRDNVPIEIPSSTRGRAEVLLIALTGAVLVVASFALSDITPTPIRGAMRYAWIIPVLWAAIRYERFATAAVVAVMAAVGFLVIAVDPASAQDWGTLSLQLISVGLSLLGLAVAATLAGRREATERMERAMAALAESEQRYARVFAASPAIQWLVDPATAQIIDANDAAARFYGYTRAQLQDMRVSDIVASGSPELVLATMAENAKAPADLLVRHRIAAGDTRLMEVHTGPIVLGARTLLHSILRDATAEVEARVEIARLAAAVEGSAEAVVTTDLGGLVTGWNPAAEALYGYPRDRAMGRPVEELLGPLETPAQEVVALVTGGGSVRFGQVVRRAAGGADVPVDLTISPIIEGGVVVGISRISHDLTGALAEEERLRRSEALLADAAEIGRMGSWEVDLESHEATWSDELYRITGVELATPVTGASLRELVHPEDRARVLPAFDLDETGDAPLAFRIVRPGGPVRHVVASWRRIAGSSGGPGRRVGVVRDATEERALEDQLRQAQRLESIGMLAGGVAHDFNNILTAIAGFTDLARYASAAGESADADLEQVQLAVTRARSLTSQLLTFGRRALVRPRPTDVAATVSSLVPMLRRLLGERVAILTELVDGAVTIIDPGQLDQVLVNLAVNARDAMPNGGNLRIAVDVTQAMIRLEVEDEGDGIPPELMDQIFLPFFTTKERGQGTGLGLATVLGIVSQAGGRIDVSSRVGEGTVFRVALPRASVDSAPGVRHQSQPAASGRGTILFVEDEDLVRRMGQRVLQHAGFTVLVAANVPDALTIADRGRPDLLAADIVLPGVGDGVTLAEELRERWPDLPVLLMTGYTERVPPDWAVLLVKPYDVTDLALTAKRMIEEAATRAAGEGLEP